MEANVGEALDRLDALAKRMENSQKFGQSLPVKTTEEWALAVRAEVAVIRKVIQGIVSQVGQ